MNVIGAIVIPIICAALSVFINIQLAHSGILPADMLAGKTPTILDVSIQLIFISAGAIASASLVKSKELSDAALKPMLGTFAGLFTVLGLLASSQQQWGWVLEYPSLTRAWGPNIIGAATIGFAVWKISQVEVKTQ